MIEEADGYIKAKAAPQSWINPLIDADIIDAAASELLTSKRYSLIPVRPEDLQLPQEWINNDVDLAPRLSVQIQQSLGGGLTAEHMKAFAKVLVGLYRYVDMWFDSDRVTSDLANEDKLQSDLRKSLIMGDSKLMRVPR